MLDCPSPTYYTAVNFICSFQYKNEARLSFSESGGGKKPTRSSFIGARIQTGMSGTTFKKEVRNSQFCFLFLRTVNVLLQPSVGAAPYIRPATIYFGMGFPEEQLNDPRDLTDSESRTPASRPSPTNNASTTRPVWRSVLLVAICTLAMITNVRGDEVFLENANPCTS